MVDQQANNTTSPTKTGLVPSSIATFVGDTGTRGAAL